MFDFRNYREPVWPEHLKPLGEGSFDKESFAPWWERHRNELGHLHPKIAEQWVHRHWFHSDFAFLPLDDLRWKLVTMGGDEILETVKRELAHDLHPEHDYDVFQGSHEMGRKHPTALALDAGTWDYPIITLSTPSGWRNHRGAFSGTRLVLVEGHQRHRYLNALHARGTPPTGPHSVFVISSPIIG